MMQEFNCKGRITISIHLSKHHISVTLMIGTWVPTNSPSHAKYCSTNFNEWDIFVVIGSIKTAKSNNVIRKLDKLCIFQMNRLLSKFIVSFLLPSLHFLNAISLTHADRREFMLNSCCIMICMHVTRNVSSRYLEAFNRIYRHNIISKWQN